MSRPNAVPACRATRITSATTTAVKTGTGIVHRIIIGTTAAGTITLNDAVGTKLVLGASFPIGSHELNIEFAGKIEVVTGAATDCTIVWT
jgi:hypothetical protein